MYCYKSMLENNFWSEWVVEVLWRVMKQISLWSTNWVPVLWTNILASITGMQSRNIRSCREIKITIRTRDIDNNHLMSQSIMTLWSTFEITITKTLQLLNSIKIKFIINNKYQKIIMYYFDQPLVWLCSPCVIIVWAYPCVDW